RHVTILPPALARGHTKTQRERAGRRVDVRSENRAAEPLEEPLEVEYTGAPFEPPRLAAPLRAPFDLPRWAAPVRAPSREPSPRAASLGALPPRPPRRRPAPPAEPAPPDPPRCPPPCRRCCCAGAAGDGLTHAATSPTRAATSGELAVTGRGWAEIDALRSRSRVSRRCSGSITVTTSPSLPARAVRPLRCRYALCSAGGSTCTTSSMPSTCPPRAATSGATRTRAEPSENALRFRSRAGWERLPCRSTLGMPAAVSCLASFLAWCLVRMNKMRRPVPE